MVKDYVFHLLLSTIFLISGVCESLGQTSKGIVPINVPIGSLSLDGNVDWLSMAYRSRITDSIQIVGIGEVTHGGYETAAFNLKMIQYLVEHKGYRNILMEHNDWYVIRPFRDHLSGKLPLRDEDIETIMLRYKYMPSSSFFTSELFKYVENHNTTNPEDTIQIAGFDLNSDPSFFEYVLHRFIIPLDYREAREYTFKLSQSSSDSDRIQIIRSWFAQNEERLKERFGKNETKWLDFHIDGVESAMELEKSIQSKSLDDRGAVVFRDSIMASNVKKLTGSAKTIVSAHNGHIMCNNQGLMGSLLKKYYLSDYYVILTDFAKRATVEVRSEEKVAGRYFRVVNLFPYASAAAVEIANRFGDSSGIFFHKNLIAHSVSDNTNAIDVFGKHDLIRGAARKFDSLVVFETISPLKP